MRSRRFRRQPPGRGREARRSKLEPELFRGHRPCIRVAQPRMAHSVRNQVHSRRSEYRCWLRAILLTNNCRFSARNVRAISWIPRMAVFRTLYTFSTFYSAVGILPHDMTAARRQMHCFVSGRQYNQGSHGKGVHRRAGRQLLRRGHTNLPGFDRPCAPAWRGS
jgi:hypothetical protein